MEKKEQKKKSYTWLWLAPAMITVIIILLNVAAYQLGKVTMGLEAWLCYSLGLLVYTAVALAAVPAPDKKKEETPTKKSAAEEPEENKKKPHDEEEEHHEMSPLARVIVALAVLILAIGFAKYVWRAVVPAAVEATNQKTDAALHTHYSQKSLDDFEREHSQPQQTENSHYVREKEVTVTDAGFPILKQEIDTFHCTIVEASEYRIYVSLPDGSDEKIYTEKTLGELQLKGAHNYRFYPKKGETMKILYTLLPRQR